MGSLSNRVATCAVALLAVSLTPVAAAHQRHHRGDGTGDRTVRFATFNASVNRNAEGELVGDLSTGTDPQLRNVAEIIQRARPDVLLVNEFDFVPDQRRRACSSRTTSRSHSTGRSRSISAIGSSARRTRASRPARTWTTTGRS
jgi:hypothetical protein